MVIGFSIDIEVRLINRIGIVDMDTLLQSLLPGCRRLRLRGCDRAPFVGIGLQWCVSLVARQTWGGSVPRTE